MAPQTYDKHEPDPRLPLLRSIQTEIEERASLIVEVERRLEAFRSTPTIHGEDIHTLESDLSTHRRELRAVEKELARLGIDFDPEKPHAILERQAPKPKVARSLLETGD